jgi:hypothetical protein
MYSPMIGFELMKTKIKNDSYQAKGNDRSQSCNSGFVDLIFFIQVHQHDGE